MLTVIIDARGGTERLPALLAQLTAGAVDGIVRQVVVVAAPDAPGVDLLCEDTGADLRPTLPAAAEAARADWLLALPSEFRFRDGWIGALEGHFTRGGGEAVVEGLATTAILRRGPSGVLLERRRLEGAGNAADLQRLRRKLGLRAVRIG
jgi:hypothetical protein